MTRARIHFGEKTIVDLAEQPDYTFPHPIQRWVMPLVILREVGEHVDLEPLGSAFAIAQNIVLTAKHNIDALLPRHHSGDHTTPMGIGLYVVYAGDSPADPNGTRGLYPVAKVTFNAGHDLAVLTIRTPKVEDGGPQFGTAPLTVDPPPQDADVIAFGYTQLAAKRTGSQSFDYRHRVTAARGKVKGLHIPYKDRSMVYFPALEGDYPSPGGMSGGPIMTAHDGKVRAAVCTSIDFEDGTWASSASLLAFLFTMSVEVKLDGLNQQWPLADLAAMGVVRTDGSHEKVQIRYEDGLMHIRWRMPRIFGPSQYT